MIKVTDLINQSVAFLKNFEGIPDYEFIITDEGLFPYSIKSTNTIVLPKSIVPLLALANLCGDDILTDYFLSKSLIDSDLYQEAETRLKKLVQMTYTERVYEHYELHRNVIFTQIIFVILHEIGHLSFNNEYLQDQIIPNLKNRIERYHEEIKCSYNYLVDLAVSYVDEIRDEYYFLAPEELREYIKQYYLDFIQTAQEKCDRRLEEFFADSFAFIIMGAKIEYFTEKLGRSFNLILSIFRVLLLTMAYSMAQSYFMCEQSMEDRFSNFANRRSMHGDTIFYSMRFINISGILQDFNLYDCYQEDIIEQHKESDIRLIKFSQKLNIWGSDDIVKLYEGNMLSPDDTYKSQLMEYYKIINRNLCAAFKIIYQ